MNDADGLLQYIEARRSRRERLAARDRAYAEWCRANGVKAKVTRLGNGMTIESRGQGRVVPHGGIINKSDFNVAKVAMW